MFFFGFLFCSFDYVSVANLRAFEGIQRPTRGREHWWWIILQWRDYWFMRPVWNINQSWLSLFLLQLDTIIFIQEQEEARNHRILQSSRLEETCKIIQYHCHHSITIMTLKLCPQVSHPMVGAQGWANPQIQHSDYQNFSLFIYFSKQRH